MALLMPLSFLFTPPRVGLTVGIAFLVFLLISLLGNPIIFWEFFKNTSTYGPGLSLKLFPLLILGSFAGPVSLSLSLILAFLFSVNVLLLFADGRFRYFKNQRLGLAGIVAGVLGVGCAACGTLLTGTLISLFGLSFVTLTLPFQSLFFQLVSIGFLLLSIGLLLRQNTRDPACVLPRSTISGLSKKFWLLFFLASAALFAGAWFFREPLGLGLIREGRLVPLAVALNEKSPAIAFAAGNYYFEGGAYDTEKAKARYLETLALAPQYPGVHYQLSRIYFIEGRLPDALTEINKELEYYPEYKRSHYVRGLVYGYLEWYELAAEDFEEFLRWKPESWAGHNDLAWIYFSMGEYPKVLDVAERGLKYNPDNVWLLNSYGLALMNVGRKDEARSALEKASVLAAAMNPDAWGRAYPGNDPRIYGEGLAAFRASIERNLKLLD